MTEKLCKTCVGRFKRRAYLPSCSICSDVVILRVASPVRMCTSLLFLWTMSMCHFAWGLSTDPLPQFRHPDTFMPPLFMWPDFERKFVVIAPSEIRVGTETNILLEAFGLSKPVVVTLTVNNYPRTQQLLQGIVTLNADNNYSVLKTITIPRKDPRQEQEETKYVQLLASFGQFKRVECICKVSFLSGYIFIQTDKPIYNPGDTVRLRAFVSSPEFQAFNSTISVEIQNTDEISVHARSEVRAADGIYSDTYELSDIVKEGKWKIVAKFDHFKENTYSANFMVKKYQLPAFNVTLIPQKSHLSLEDKELEVKVYAKYVYGEKVDGVAYVVFGVENDGVKVRVSSMKQVKNLDGGNATLTVAELKKAYPDIKHLDDLSIYVKTSVMTSTGSDLVEAEKSGIKVVSAPYVLAVEDTSRFYKPGLPFDLTVTVSHHDGSPAPNVPVKISFLSTPVKMHSGTIKVSLYIPCSFVPRTIKVKTVVPGLKPEQQAKTEWEVEAFTSRNIFAPNQLHIKVDKEAAKVGAILDFQLHVSRSNDRESKDNDQISYAVLNKGKIIRAGRVNITEDEPTNVSLLVTSEMLPAFRFVAYYIFTQLPEAEAVADSILVNVESQCLGSLKVEPLGGEVKHTYTPGDSFSFQVRGDPGAKVSLVAVDNAVFLLSKSRLTQRKIWDTLGHGDLGCSAGGGLNSLGVFLDAGLNFRSSFQIPHEYIMSSHASPCFWKKPRKRRSAEKLHLREELEKSYSDQFLQRCCSDGMREIPMAYSCRRRALYITENWSCVMAFLQCCAQYRGEELGVITPPPSTTPEPATPTPLYRIDGLPLVPLPGRVYHHFVGGFPPGHGYGSPVGVPGVVPGGFPGVVPGVVSGVVPGVFPGGAPFGVPGGVPVGVPGVVPAGVPVGVPPGGPLFGVPGGVPFDVPGGVPGDVPGGALVPGTGLGAAFPPPGGVPGGVPGGAPVPGTGLGAAFPPLGGVPGGAPVVGAGFPPRGGVGFGVSGGAPVVGAGLGAAFPSLGEREIPTSRVTDEYYDKLDDIYVRTKFFESWLWTDLQLPGAPGPDGLAVAPVESVLPDSITQWGILGVSASSSTGFCVAEPFNIRAWKPFFINLRLPHTAARNEHVEVKAVLHNYMSKDLKVLVILAKTEDMCSVAFTEDHKQEVLVQARSSVLIPYTIIPLRAGELPLQVTVMSRSFSGQDAVRKSLRVVVEGIQKTDVRSFVLNPAEKGDSNGNQLIRVDKAKLSSVVPNSLPETFINVRGHLLADSIDNSISTDSLAALIRMPGGCVEQNLASIIMPLIATHYLDRSSQWESVGIQRRDEAISYIKRGYENQLHYRKTDDSYPPYRKEGTSTWITAFVVKVFSMAFPFITVDKQHICGPLRYLLKHKQLSSGAFKEDNPVYTTSMTGGLQGAESKETLTAFVLIALAEAKSVVTCSDPELEPEVGFIRAGQYLKARYQRLRRPYSVAIACYALAVSNQGCMKSVLLKSASPERTHWPDADNRFFTLEATGYALLALLKGGHVQEASTVFKWLNQERGVGGGYGSTQSTVVVLQALSEYLVKQTPPADMSLKVVLSVPGSSDTHWAFTRQLAHVARSSKVPIDQDFTVVASGSGQGILEVVTVYNELPDVHEKSSCNGFDLNVSISESNEKPPAEAEKVFKLSISVRALAQHQVRMAVLDISLPTGFEPENADLELLSNSVDRYINNFQVVDNLSDRGSLIIHLFKVFNKEADIITFRLNQKFKVGLLQPSTVTVYQYYNTDKRCTRFYTPPEDKEQLSHCTEGDCCILKTGAQTAAERKKAACGTTHHVYKVRVLSVRRSQYDRYELEILQVINEGSEVGLKEKDTRVFLSHAACRTGLNLITGQDYLIIGPASDIWQAGSDKTGYTYTLGKDTWVEHWPLGSCEKCTELDDLSVELLNFGCQT